MTKDFNTLVKKLNSFRNKYYTYKIAKGILVSFFLLLTIFVIITLIEFFVYFPSEIRLFIFYGFNIFGVLLCIQYIILPFFKLIRILRPINIRNSSFFIKKHFPEIKDKLINIIELSEIYDNNYSQEIIEASIDQKIKELDVFNFKEAVQFKNLKIISVYFLLSIFITSSIYFFKRSVFSDSINRIVHYNVHFFKPAPYNFILLNNDLNVKKGEKFKIILECRGDNIPSILYINIEGNNYLMKSASSGKFEYEIASVINPLKFYFTDLKNESAKYLLNVLPSPGINYFQVKIIPPAYTGIKEQIHNNKGDIQVPAGSDIRWKFQGIDIDSLYFCMSDSSKITAIESEDGFIVEKNCFESVDYQVYIKNNMTGSDIAFSYSIEVIPDLYPEIKIVQVQDSIQMTRYFFKGVIEDDYGFSALNFHYNIDNNDSTINIPIIKNLNAQDFYFGFDFSQVKINTASVTYYFSVTDNDVINNFKTTTSGSFIFDIPDKREIIASETEQFKNIEKMLQESQNIAKQIQDDIQDLRFKSMDSNISEWEKSQKVNDIISKQNKLEELYEKIKKDNQKLSNYSNSFNKYNDEIKAKQLQVEQLLEEVFTDELKRLLEEFNKLTEEFNYKDFHKLSDKLNLSYEDLQKQLDRNLEMLRKMKVEQKFQKTIEDINRLADEEEEFLLEISEKKNYENITEKVLKHKEDIQKLENDIRDALEMNKELNKPFSFDDFKEEFNDINNSIEESIEQLEKQNFKKSISKIKQTSKNLKNTAYAMQQMLDSNFIRQNLENIENLRQILSNLIFLSFSQEEILVNLKGVNVNDPLLSSINLKQRKIKNQSGIVKDSLYALAKRTPQINSMVNNELLTIEINLDKISKELEEGMLSNARGSQQYVMTAINNLALMLNEALENLEKQLAEAEPGLQQCEKSGCNKDGMSLLKKTSENIKQQLEQMIEQLKEGESQKMNPQFGKLLMQHELMQQMLREMMNEGTVGSTAKQVMQQIDNMLEQNRRQLIDKNINSQMISRQNQITTRLLKAEKSELEREYEDERESKVAEDFYSNPVEIFEYHKEKNFTIENLNRDSYKLTNFYNKKFRQYLNNVDK